MEPRDLGVLASLGANGFMNRAMFGGNPSGTFALHPNETKQRTLISGRDFKDILEACRPRNIADSLPSALRAAVNHYSQDGKCPLEDISNRNNGPTTGKLIFNEWGDLDAARLEGSALTVKQGSRGIEEGRFRAAASTESLEKSETSERSSQSSSFASQFSNVFGKSLEVGSPSWNFAAGYQPAMASSSLRIQRPPSVDFEKLVESQASVASSTDQVDKAPEEEFDESRLRERMMRFDRSLTRREEFQTGDGDGFEAKHSR